MDVSTMMFGWVLAKILLTRLIIELEVFLSFAIKEPEVTHFNCTRLLLFDGVIDNSDSGGIVATSKLCKG